MNNGIRIVKLACVGCGANLEITQQMGRFACAHCGTSQIVERSGGAIHLRGVAEAISRVQVGTDKTAAELAIARLTKEYEATQQQRAAAQGMLMNQRAQAAYEWRTKLGSKNDTVKVVSVVIALFSILPWLVVAALLHKLVSMASSALANFVSIVVVLVGMAATGFLMRNLMHRSDNYNPEKLRRDYNSEIALVDQRISKELSVYDQRLSQLKAKINENYKIANS